MKKKLWFDVVQVHCPFCINHLLGNAIINGMDVSGAKVTTYAVESNRPHARFTEKVTGSDMTPFSLAFEEDVFMNRRVWKPVFFTIGAFDEYMNYQFKKKYLNIEI